MSAYKCNGDSAYACGSQTFLVSGPQLDMHLHCCLVRACVYTEMRVSWNSICLSCGILILSISVAQRVCSANFIS